MEIVYRLISISASLHKKELGVDTRELMTIHQGEDGAESPLARSRE